MENIFIFLHVVSWLSRKFKLIMGRIGTTWLRNKKRINNNKKRKP